MKTRCPTCGKRNDGSFCIICGTPARTGSMQGNLRAQQNIIAWFRALDMSRKAWVIGGLALISLLCVFIALPTHRPPVVSVNTSAIPNAVAAGNPPTTTPHKAQSAPTVEETAPIGQSQPTFTVIRKDPPHEASVAQIATVLRQAQLVGVFCGDDVDQQTCKFFGNALAVDLKSQHVGVTLYYLPEGLFNPFTSLLCRSLSRM